MSTSTRNERIESVVTRIAHMIRMLRLIRGLSQQDLARGLGVTFQQVQKYEKGTTHISTSRLYDIARLLGAPIEIFFRDLETDDTAWALTCGMVDRYRRLSPQFGIHEFMELNRGFLAIQDADVRRSILNLMQEVADAGDGAAPATRTNGRSRPVNGSGAEGARRERPPLALTAAAPRRVPALEDGEVVR